MNEILDQTVILAALGYAVAFAVCCLGVLLLCVGFSYAYETVRRWQYWIGDDSDDRPNEIDGP